MTEARIYNQDCVEGMGQNVGSGEVDVIVTSPPYNTGISYLAYDDRKTLVEYMDMIRGALAEMARCLSRDGSLFVNIGGKSQRPEIPFLVAQECFNRLQLQNTIIWVKSVSVDDNTYGHFRPIQSERFVNHTWEFLFHLTHTGKVPIDREAVGVPYMDKSNISRWGKTRDLRCKGDVWFIPYETTKSSRENPAEFPVRLAEDCLKLHGPQTDVTVMDPFAGSGTVLEACLNLKRERFIGFELYGYECDKMRRMAGESPSRV